MELRLVRMEPSVPWGADWSKKHMSLRKDLEA